ncbi:MAG: hypothetical protein QOE91_130, partial [Gaiellaceae bacterium]|nr:hypothetical protein [Gaiellaceae bacterium]
MKLRYFAAGTLALIALLVVGSATPASAAGA